MDWNPDFEAAYAAMHEPGGSSCLFITGKAGTGKSMLLRHFRKHTALNIAVLAPTGIAALHVEGQTIHSFFGFPPRPLDASHLERRRNWRFYAGLNAIVIDEISMVRADWLDGIDLFLRNNTGRSEPFGGIRLVCMGDLFQLPPVVGSPEEAAFLQKNYPEGPYFFCAKVFKKFPIDMIELREVYRQSDRRFVHLLDALRTNQMDFDDLELLNSRCLPERKPSGHILLTARNLTAESVNRACLEALETEAYSYIAQVSGEVPVLPAETPLELKVGAQVVFLKNDPKRRFVNGSIGKVSALEPDRIEVRVRQGEERLHISVERHEWDIYKYEYSPPDNRIVSRPIGSFAQFPLRLAWAMTVHKSQGQTFDRVLIDLDKGAFEFGQTYVALSRCRSLNGILLRRPLRPQDVRVDARIVDFYEQHR